MELWLICHQSFPNLEAAYSRRKGSYPFSNKRRQNLSIYRRPLSFNIGLADEKKRKDVFHWLQQKSWTCIVCRRHIIYPK